MMMKQGTRNSGNGHRAFGRAVAVVEQVLTSRIIRAQSSPIDGDALKWGSASDDLGALKYLLVRAMTSAMAVEDGDMTAENEFRTVANAALGYVRRQAEHEGDELVTLAFEVAIGHLEAYANTSNTVTVTRSRSDVQRPVRNERLLRMFGEEPPEHLN